MAPVRGPAGGPELPAGGRVVAGEPDQPLSRQPNVELADVPPETHDRLPAAVQDLPQVDSAAAARARSRDRRHDGRAAHGAGTGGPAGKRHPPAWNSGQGRVNRREYGGRWLGNIQTHLQYRAAGAPGGDEPGAYI